MRKKITEIAAGGSTGAGSIATVPSRMGAMQTRMRLKDFMIDFYGRVKNRGNFKPVKFGSIKEAHIMESSNNPFQLDTAMSKLKGAEQESGYEKRDSISFGIEDEKENLLVITVPIQQAEEFEKEVARALADVLAFKKTGDGEDKSLAELLYDLKSKFTIVDARFPKIPTTAVYNADEISTVSEQDQDREENEFEDEAEDEVNPEDEEQLGDEEDLNDIEDENVSDFDEEQDEVSLLRDVLDLLKTQSEEKIATAKAEEEKAKAMQAKIATKQAYNKLEAEEDMIETEAEMEAKKEKEKEADRLADVLKYRYKNKNENFSSLFRGALLNELDPMDTPQSLRRQMAAIRSKYQPGPNDTKEEKRFKREQMQLAQRELRVKLRAARNRQDYERKQQQQPEEPEPEDQQQQNKPNREDRVRPQRDADTTQDRGL